MPTRLTAQQRIDRATTERQLQDQVEGLLSFTGWRWWHAPDNRPVIPRGGGRPYVQDVRAGWPDLFAVRGPHAIALELKREVNAPVKAEQLAWLLALRATGVDVAVIRPSMTVALTGYLQRGAIPRVRFDVDLTTLELVSR